MNKIVSINLPEKCRILVVSDIHTHWELLDRLLKKAEYDPGDDYLVIVGDILEHGSDNIRTLEYIKDLAEKSDKVTVLLGNNDAKCVNMVYSCDFKSFQQQFYRNENNTFRQMAESLGFADCWEGNWLEMREKVAKEYDELLSFVKGMPICLETEEYIFVHAGVENRPDWRNTDNSYALNAGWFLREENPTGKWLVVGHYPTYNYNRSHSTNLPIIDKNKRMICIDGGMTIKQACQLNMLVIEKNADRYTHDVIWETNGMKATVAKDFSCSLTPVYVDWEKQDMTILEDMGYVMKLRDSHTGNEGIIPRREVFVFDGKPHVYQFLSSFPSVKKGEQVFVFTQDETMALVITKNAVVGWLPTDILCYDE